MPTVPLWRRKFGAWLKCLKSANLPQWGVKITVSDVEMLDGKSGIGLRCTLTLSLEHPILGKLAQTTRGCLAFRNAKNDINFLTPVIWVGPGKARYRPMILSPALATVIQQELEKRYGPHMKRKEKDRKGQGIALSRIDPTLSDSLEVEYA